MFKDRRISSDRACGTVVAYDSMNIRIWGMAKRQGIGTIILQMYIAWKKTKKKSVLVTWIQGHNLRMDLLRHPFSKFVLEKNK